jgi:multidrug resistance efflux pump
MASPDSRLKRALIDPEIFEAKVNQARADDLAKPRVPNQQAQVDRARADVENAHAAHAEGKTQRHERA